jgi:homogentisate 1,2-dioxygenase
MIFIHKGKEITLWWEISSMEITLLSRGVIYQIDFDTAVNRLLYVESFAPIYTPKRYKMNQDNT